MQRRNWIPVLRYAAIAGFGLKLVSEPWDVGITHAPSAGYAALGVVVAVIVLAFARSGFERVRRSVDVFVPLGCYELAHQILGSLFADNAVALISIARPIQSFTIFGFLLTVIYMSLLAAYVLWQTMVLLRLVERGALDLAADFAEMCRGFWRGSFVLALCFLTALPALPLAAAGAVGILLFASYAFVPSMLSLVAVPCVMRSRTTFVPALLAGLRSSWSVARAHMRLFAAWFLALGSLTWSFDQSPGRASTSIHAKIPYFPTECEWYADACETAKIAESPFLSMPLYALFTVLAYSAMSVFFERAVELGFFGERAPAINDPAGVESAVPTSLRQ